MAEVVFLRERINQARQLPRRLPRLNILKALYLHLIILERSALDLGLKTSDFGLVLPLFPVYHILKRPSTAFLDYRRARLICGRITKRNRNIEMKLSGHVQQRPRFLGFVNRRQARTNA